MLCFSGCLAGPSPLVLGYEDFIFFNHIPRERVYLAGSTMHCYDILSGGASVTGNSDLKNARTEGGDSFFLCH